MPRATQFLLGSHDVRGRSVETYLRADDRWLEERHDWVQWAFPNQTPSAFNDEAPLWTADEARALPPMAVANLRRLLARYRLFLTSVACWRRPFDHNHARITRVLLCLRDAGLHAEARAFHRLVTAAPEPGARSRRYWRDALARPSMTLRPFAAADVEACVAVLASSVPEFAAAHEVNDLRSFFGRMERWGCRYVVGELDGRIVACGGLGFEPARAAAVLCWGLVERSLHGVGLGTRLVLERLAWIVDDPAWTRVELGASQRTRGFFARFGFEDAKVTPDGYAPGLHRHDMVLTLDDARREALRAMLAPR